MSEPSDRLQGARRKSGFATASEAARSFGWNENTYRSHENGERGLTLKAAIKYARAFRTTYQHLMTGAEESELKKIAILRGEIRQKGVMKIYNPKNMLRHVDLPMALPGNPYCYLVDTDAMFPRYERGDLVVMWGDENWLESSKRAEGVVWINETTAYFGVTTEHRGSVTIDVIGAAPRRDLQAKRFEVVRCVVRDQLYGFKMPPPSDEDPASETPSE